MTDDSPKRAAIAARLERGLREAGLPTRAEHEKRYLKSELEHFGASVPAIRRIAKSALSDETGLTRAKVVAVVETLWNRRVHGCRMAAVELLDLRSDLLGPGDLELEKRTIRELRTWALADGLAASVAAALVERHPELAAVSIGGRRTATSGSGAPPCWPYSCRCAGASATSCGSVSDSMLEEREFFIRKAIGWVLRVTARKRPDLVYAWLEPRAARASGVTIREAVKYLSAPQRDTILATRRPQP